MAPTQESGLRENCTSRLSEARQVEMDGLPTKPDVKPTVDQAVQIQSTIETEDLHCLDRAGLKYAGANAAFQMRAATRFQNDAFDAGAMEEMRQNSPAGPAPLIATCVRIQPSL
jgi:hypothetical protein